MKIVKKIFKTLFFSLSGIVLLLLIMVFLLRTGSLNGFLASVATSRINDLTEGQFRIQRIEGNIFSRFSLEEIQLTQGDSTVFTLQNLQVGYSVSKLLKKEISADFLRLKSLQIQAVQKADSTWNFQDFLKPGRQKARNDTISKPFEWKINVEKIQIDSLRAKLYPLNKEKIPSLIKANAEVAFVMKQDTISASMKHIDAETFSPHLKVEEMGGFF